MYAEQVIDVFDDLGVAKGSIEGESLGGWVAMYAALNYPDRVDKLILNTAAGIQWNRDKVKIDDAGGTNMLRDRSLAAIANPNRETIRKRLEWLMASPDRVTDELVDLRYAIYSRPDTNVSLTEVFKNSFGTTSMNRIEEDDLQKIKAPTLSLWSEKIRARVKSGRTPSQAHSGIEPLLHSRRRALAAVGETGRARPRRTRLSRS